MSFQIFWDVLDKSIEQKLLNFLNKHFSSTPLPTFISSLSFSNLSFGTIPPSVTIIDIAEPYPIFYDEHQPTKSDAQIKINFEWHGDCSARIDLQLAMNYPVMNFVSLPVQLCLRSIGFQGTAVLAYCKNCIHFCFLDSDVSVLKSIKVESILGDGSKHVLKNVDKVEQFIFEQLRRLLEDQVVFPSCQTIELSE